MTLGSRVRAQVENRYEARYPRLRVVSRQTLHVIKRLRASGIAVEVDGDPYDPLHYTFEKGIGSWPSDPTVLFAINVAAAVVTGVVSNWLWDRIKRDREFPSATLAILAEDTDGEVRCYGMDGMPLKRNEADQVLDRARRSASTYAKSLSLVPPNTRNVYPVYLEHSGRVIGWAEDFRKNEQRGTIEIIGLEIVDPRTKRRFESGELSAFSVAGIARRAICSICREDYTQCDHVAGEMYGGISCVDEIEELLLGEFSLVADPINPAMRILR
jgi:hypothetical protein